MVSTFIIFQNLIQSIDIDYGLLVDVKFDTVHRFVMLSRNSHTSVTQTVTQRSHDGRTTVARQSHDSRTTFTRH